MVLHVLPLVRSASTAAGTKARSKIQVQVLCLYKECLRSAEKKQPEAKNYVRRQFKENGSNVPRTDTMRIENLLRQGKRRLQMFNDPNVDRVGHFVE